MSIGLVYWILMLVWFVFGVLSYADAGLIHGYGMIGNVGLVFILFALLGWKNFGPPVHA